MRIRPSPFLFGDDAELDEPISKGRKAVSRRFDNIILLLVIFIPVVAILSLITSFLSSNFALLLVTDAIAIVAMCYLYRIWDNRPIRLRCDKCRKIVLSNVPWVCGFCKKLNNDWIQYPFVAECAYCGNEPKVFKCRHTGCGEPIFLSEDQAVTNIASHPLSEMPGPDERTAKRQAHEGSMEDKQNKIAIAELNLKLKNIQDRIKDPKAQTPSDPKQAMYEEEYDGMMGFREYLRKKTAEVKERYKDDPEMLQDALDAIEEIRKKFM